ncbi:MAG: LamG domain-containing protein, partial [Verrucomicrobiae bacterium]|nr:LamG domain-containing protein [Verrucomicrobiae bacterium]
DGGGFVATAPLSRPLGEKTLEAVVQLGTLDQRAGGVMTVQDLKGSAFDSIVFAERQPGHWLAGSNSFARTLDFQGTEEKEADRQPVHLTIVYEADGTIRAYRNGQAYGEPIRKAPMHTFSAGETQVVFGLRHGTAPAGNKPLRGRIFEARLYDRALSPEEVAATAGGDRVYVTEKEVLDSLTEGQRSEKIRLESEIASLTGELDSLRRLGSEVPPEQRRWQDLAHAIFNLKEFIYLR